MPTIKIIFTSNCFKNFEKFPSYQKSVICKGNRSLSCSYQVTTFGNYHPTTGSYLVTHCASWGAASTFFHITFFQDWSILGISMRFSDVTEDTNKQERRGAAEFHVILLNNAWNSKVFFNQNSGGWWTDLVILSFVVF